MKKTSLVKNIYFFLGFSKKCLLICSSHLASYSQEINIFIAIFMSEERD